MSIHRVAGRYAKSLLDLSKDQNNTETILGDINAFIEMCKNRDLTLLLTSPIVNATKKASIFKALFEGKFQPLTLAFFDIVLKKGREALLPNIAKAFVGQYKELNGITTVKLTTATELSSENLEALKTKLLSSEMTGKKLEIHTAVNPDILGGFVIEVEDNLIDNSIAYKLSQIKKQFSGTEYIKQ